jgi:hypothetical protein
MGRLRTNLAIAANVATILAVVSGGASWVYHHAGIGRPLWTGKVSWLGWAFGLSLLANVLFSIGSRIQAKSVPMKVAQGFHSGKINGGEAALFWHYSACSRNLANQLEKIRHHWQDAGEVLLYPLGNNPLKNLDHYGSIDFELRDFRLIYGEHLYWLDWEIPEFSTTLPPLGSGVEYLTLLNELKTHSRLLDEAAKQICEAEPVGKEQPK